MRKNLSKHNIASHTQFSLFMYECLSKLWPVKIHFDVLRPTVSSSTSSYPTSPKVCETDQPTYNTVWRIARLKWQLHHQVKTNYLNFKTKFHNRHNIWIFIINKDDVNTTLDSIMVQVYKRRRGGPSAISVYFYLFISFFLMFLDSPLVIWFIYLKLC